MFVWTSDPKILDILSDQPLNPRSQLFKDNKIVNIFIIYKYK